MNRIGWTVQSAIGALLVAALAGCGTSQTRPLDASRSAAIESEVTEFLTHYRETFNSRDLDAIVRLFATDDRFALYEDGTLRYPDPQSIVAALASLPPGMSMATEGNITEITPLTDELATASTTYRTQVSMPGGGSFSIEGVMTALLEDTEDGWRLVQAHTSSVRERQRR